MSPLQGTQAIPAGWAEHHRPVARSSMQSGAVFKRIASGPAPYPLPDGYDPTGETIWGTPEAPVPVRVQQLNRQNGSLPTNQPTRTHEYLVTAPVEGPAIRSGERGDLILVEGRTLRIIDEAHGTYLWERDFTCIDNLTQQNPPGGTE